MCTGIIHENYKLFVNPLFKTNWFCTRDRANSSGAMDPSLGSKTALTSPHILAGELLKTGRYRRQTHSDTDERDETATRLDMSSGERNNKPEDERQAARFTDATGRMDSGGLTAPDSASGSEGVWQCRRRTLRVMQPPWEGGGVTVERSTQTAIVAPCTMARCRCRWVSLEYVSLDLLRYCSI